jgi:hypothetical protein
MHIHISSMTQFFVSPFQKNLFQELTAKQKTILAIVTLAFGMLAAYYVVRGCLFHARAIHNEGFSILNGVEEEDNRVEQGYSTIERVKIIQSQAIPTKKKIEKLELEYQKTKDDEFLIASLEMDPKRLIQHADIIFQNCSNLEDANVICMGECHVIERHSSLEQFIIDTFSKPNDVHLIEGSEGIIKDCTIEEWENLIVVGWDHMESFTKYVQVMEKIFRYDESPEDSEERREFIELNELSSVYSKLRNQALIKAIVNHRVEYPLSKIFVIAGRRHLKEKGYNILEFLPKEEKCAVVLFHKIDGEVSDQQLSQHSEKLFSSVKNDPENLLQSLH